MNVEDEVKALWSLDAATLKARYRAVFDREPRVGNPAWLRRKIAWELQARAYGGLSTTALKRIDELIAEMKLPIATDRMVTSVKSHAKNAGLTPGTTIVRNWRGRDLHLRALEDGFEVDGVRYGTLTAAAKGVTGSHWNGTLFWGVKPRRKTS